MGSCGPSCSSGVEKGTRHGRRRFSSAVSHLYSSRIRLPLRSSTRSTPRAAAVCAAHCESPLVCPRCSSKMRILAVIIDPNEVKKILPHRVKIGRPPFGLDPAALNWHDAPLLRAAPFSLRGRELPGSSTGSPFSRDKVDFLMPSYLVGRVTSA